MLPWGRDKTFFVKEWNSQVNAIHPLCNIGLWASRREQQEAFDYIAYQLSDDVMEFKEFLRNLDIEGR